MMLREELEGMAPPDQFDDPIAYHLWFEANKCPSCNGTGSYWPESDSEAELRKARLWECRTCDGTGLITEQFDPDF